MSINKSGLFTQKGSRDAAIGVLALMVLDVLAVSGIQDLFSLLELQKH